MNENADLKNEEVSPGGDKDVAALLKKMQRRLDSMEEKIDSLVRQSKQKTFDDRRPLRSHKEFDRTSRPKEGSYGRKKEEVSSEGKFYHGRPFGKKKDAGKSSFKKGRKPFKKSSKPTRGASR